MGRSALRRRAGIAVLLAVAVTACSSGTASPPAAGGSAAGPAATTPPATTPMAAFRARTTVPPTAFPAQPEGVAWPTQEWPEGPLLAGVDAAAVQSVLDRAVGELSPSEMQATDAVLVVQGGRIVAETYRPAWGDRSKTHRSWSMAKSFTQALTGILVGQGRLDVYERADVPEWSDPTDPRHEITVDQLLRMASGLAWKEEYFAPDSDTIAMLGGAGKDDMAHFAASKPLEVPPDSRVRYSTGTSNIVAGVIGRIVGPGDPYRAFVEDELLRPIGIDPARTDVGWDGAGNLIGGSVFDLTARDYARFGLLYLRGGVWDGRRIVPEGWVDYGRTPTPPPAGTTEYGAHWWTYEDCPEGFRAGGFNGQHIVVCPTLDLVVVVLSNRTDGQDGKIRDSLVAAFRDAAPAG